MWLTILLLSIGLSLDAAAVALTYSLRGVRIPLSSKLTIGLCSLVYAALALWAGSALSTVLPGQAARWIGIATLGALGAYSLIKAYCDRDKPDQTPAERVPSGGKGEKTLLRVVIRSLGITIQVLRNPSLGDLDDSRCIDIKEALLLGLALSLDAIGAGAGAALSGVASASMPFAIAITQVLFLYLGAAIGKRASGLIPARALSFLPGCILLAIALLRVFT